MAYANGQVPLNLLVKLGEQHYLPPGTAARWLWFVAEGKRRWGVTFYITGPSSRGWDGWNGYRPLDIQRKYKDAFGNMAAAVGRSSHGGFYGGQEVFAIDVANWQAVTWSRFSGLAAEAGFRVDFVTPQERWHIGDFNNPWVVDPKFGDDMGTIDNTEQNYQTIAGFIQRAFKYDARPNGLGADWKHGPTVFESLNGAQNKGLTDAQVKVVADAVVKAIGTPSVTIDYARVAKSVNDELARRVAS